MKLSTKNIRNIMRLRPCYNPVSKGFLEKDWEGTALDVLKVQSCPVEDRLWVVCHRGWIDDDVARRYVCWLLRQVTTVVHVDTSFLKAVKAVERYVAGKGTKKEIYDVWYEAQHDTCVCAKGVKEPKRVSFDQWRAATRMLYCFLDKHVAQLPYHLSFVLAPTIAEAACIRSKRSKQKKCAQDWVRKTKKRLLNKLIKMLSQ